MYKYQLNGLKTYTHPKIIKLTEKQKEKLLDIGIGNVFLDMTPKAQAIKEKIGKWNCMKSKRLWTAEKTTELKGNLQDRGKYLQFIYLIGVTEVNIQNILQTHTEISLAVQWSRL